MLNSDYKEMLRILSEEAVEFIVVGAYALAYHGFPRATGDMDVWVNPTSENAQRVFQAIARFGAPVGEISANDFSLPGTVFQIGVAPRRIDIVTSIDGVDFHTASAGKMSVEIEDMEVPILSIDDLIKNKESTGRDKDALDAKMLRRHKGN